MASCSRVAADRRPAVAHFRQRSRLARSWMNVVGTCFIAARSTSLGVLHREQRSSSHGKPALMAWSIVGEGSIGSPSDHIRSFQLSHSNLSACCSMISALARISVDCAVRMLAIARDLPSSFLRACGRLRKGASGDTSAPSSGAYDLSNVGQQPSSSWRPVRLLQVLSSSR